jgi:hypothetical protein
LSGVDAGARSFQQQVLGMRISIPVLELRQGWPSGEPVHD